MPVKTPAIPSISRFSVKMFLLIMACVVLPFCVLCFYVRNSMEGFIQEKLSERIIQNIARNESYICDKLQDMAFLSNTFVYDEEFCSRIAEESYTQYENTSYFNKILERMALNGGYEGIDETKIIIFDQFDRVYSNWSLNYQDYKFLLEQDWVKESETQGGHAVWSMFSPAYIAEEKTSNRYISLAKVILSEGTSGDRIGTIIISIEQLQFGRLLMEYAYEEDVAYVCVEEAEVLLTNDKENLVGDSIGRLYEQTQSARSGSLQENINGKEYLISYYTIPKPWVFNDSQMKVFHFTNYEEVSSQVQAVSRKMNTFIILVVFMILAISYRATRMLVRPIEKLTEEMEHYTLDTQVKSLDVTRKDEIGKLNRAFYQMSDNIKGLFIRLEEEKEIKEKYRFESLRAQLNPHFLFNTLTSIRFMAIIRGADNIVESIDALAHMLKYSMSREDGIVTLQEELDNIKNYIYIQNCRYGEHCQLHIEIPEELKSLRIMKFILQPIVENAVIHGYDKNKNQIMITISGRRQGPMLVIVVEDDGVGMSREVIERLEGPKNSRVKESKLTGIGLANVDECIKISYGSEYGLKLESESGKGTRVIFRLPVADPGKE